MKLPLIHRLKSGQTGAEIRKSHHFLSLLESSSGEKMVGQDVVSMLIRW
jgi:hypothetical protein